MTDHQLVGDAQTRTVGAGASVKMQRRLKDAIEGQTKATTKLGWIMLWLTIVGVLLAAIQTAPLIVRLWK